MTSLFVPQAGQTPAARRRAPAPARHVPRAATLLLIGCALAPLLAGGCAMDYGVSRVWEVTPSRFESVVLRSQQPVLVNFYKPG